MKLFSSLAALLLAEVLFAQSPCLIASYPFNGNAIDVTGNGHDGTVTGATPAMDRFGNPAGCYLFDGIDDLIELSGSFTGSNGSFLAWVNVTSFTEANQLMVANGTDDFSNTLTLTLTSDQQVDGLYRRLYCLNDQRQCDPSALSYTMSDPAQVPENWTFVAISADDAALHLFIDGVEVSTISTAGIQADSGLWFDDLCGGAAQVLLGSNLLAFYSGKMDDAAFYDCALTASQIDSIHDAQSNGQACLIANYTFNGTADDMTSNGHNGTVFGATPAPDRFGNDDSCYQFDGIDDYIDISGTWTGSNGTISAYIHLDDLDDFRPIFQHDDNDHLGNSLAMNIDCATCQDSSRLWFGFDHRECGGDLQFTVTQPKLEPGVWTHVAMSADDNTTQLYINCVEVPTYLYGNNPGLWFDDLCPGPFTARIGKSVASDGSEFHFKGRIDDLRVYNCALSAEEITALCDINTATAELGPSARISVYPNPTTGLLRFTNLPENAFPHVFDATGRRISVGVQQQGSEQVIDLSAYPIGLYIVRIAERSFSIVRQ